MEKSDQLPFTIQDVDNSEAYELMKYFTGEHSGFVRVGPKGYFFPQKFKEQAKYIYNLPLRSDDVFVASYPRSGSTWMRELVWMVANDFDYAKSSAVPLFERYVFLEFTHIVHPKMMDILYDENIDNDHNIKNLRRLVTPGYERLASTPSPRFVNTHLPLSLLPPRLLDSSKVVYMARDPRDVVVSFYHLNRLYRVLGFDGDFKTFWDFFRTARVYWTPYFETIKEAWKERNHTNMLFLFYEDVSKDLPSTIRRVASFLKKSCSEDQVARLCQHLSIESFRNNKSVNDDLIMELGVLAKGEQPFIRKGKPGGWRDYFTEEMEQQAHDWILENLCDTDLRFPSMTG